MGHILGQRGKFVYRTVGTLTVKGKTKPVEVFGVLSDVTVPPPAWLAVYNEAIQLYRSRKFAEAFVQFEKAQKQIGTNDFLCATYLLHCAAYIEKPPAPDWDGSITLAEK